MVTSNGRGTERAARNGHTYGHAVQGPDLRGPRPAQEPRLHGGRDHHHRTGDRRLHRDLQRRQRRAAAAVAVRRRAAAGDWCGASCAHATSTTGRSRRRIIRDLRQQSTELFEDIAGLIPAGRTPISDAGGEPEQIRVGGATPNFFRVLGARDRARARFHRRRCDAAAAAAAARDSRRRRGAPPRLPAIAIISHAFWMRRYGGDPEVIGKDVDLGGGRAQIVGVLAPDFEMLFPPRANVERVPDMWTAARINFETANRNNVAFRGDRPSEAGRHRPAGADAGRSRRGRPAQAVSRSSRRRASISTPCRCSRIWSAMCGRRFCR